MRTLVTPETYDGVKYEPFDPLVKSDINDWPPSAWHDAHFLNLTSIMYSPCNNKKVDRIMSLVKHPTLKVGNCLLNAKALELAMMAPGSAFRILAGIQFDDSLINNGDKLPDDIDIKIRFPSEVRTEGTSNMNVENWRTEFLYPLFQSGGPRSKSENEGAKPYYNKEGFLPLQKSLGQAIIRVVQTENHAIEDFPNILMQRYPYPAWVSDPLLVPMENMVGFIFMLSFFYTCIKTVQIITIEKEKQLKESMKIMGLPNWLHWAAWFVKTYILLLISIILMTIIVKVMWVRNPDLAVFTHSDGGVIFIFLMLYMFATTTFCFAVSVFFSKANTAATVAGLLWFVTYVPFDIMRMQYQDLSLSTVLPTSLLFNTAMAYGLQLITMWETTEEGAQFSNIWKTVSPDDDLMLGQIMMMLIVDGIIYLLVALYVEAVFPGEYGVPKPWYFPVTKSYWCGDDLIENDLSEMQNGNLDKSIFEPEPKDFPIGIQIKGLRKVFSNKKVAVRDMNLNMYEGQITALLGHNGAGKTTTMSILTGMFPPTSGTAYVAGHDVRTQIEAARSSLGLCPQHNILFDTLTVEEHLTFFGKLKGLSGSAVKHEVDKFINLLELEPKRHVMSASLSGGMKRKLSVGIALCGNSKVVMLDEPTAGMDPAARRAIWDILQEQKHGRTILLTTHFMDEADLLGDRIAIMAGGQLQCCGSSFFLKKRYGTGYHLIMEKTPRCDVGAVTSLFRKYIPNIDVDSHVGSELSYMLAEDHSHLFETMLSDLESKSESLGILSYGISLATLEEVFMKVGADHGQEEINNALEKSKKNNFVKRKLESESPSSATRLDVETMPLVKGRQLLMNQTLAMFMKKALSYLRTWYLYVLQIVIAIVFIVLTIVIARGMPTEQDLPEMEITFDRYEDPVTVISTKDVTDDYYKAALGIINSQKRQLEDLKTSDMTDYILKKTKEVPSVVRNRYLVGTTIDSDDNKIIAWFNNNPYHTPPLALDLVINTVLKKFSPKHTITISNHPIPYTLDAKLRQLNQMGDMSYMIAVNLVFSMSIISAFYIMFYIRERVTKSKHLQFVSGVEVFTFWVTAFLWDLITYIVIAVAIVITLVIFQEDGFSTATELGRLFSMLLVFGIAMLPLNYLFAFLFEQPSTGFTRMILLNVFTGVASLILTQVLGIESLDLMHVQRAIHWVFLFVPLYSMGAGIRDMGAMFSIYNLCKKFVDICVESHMGNEEQCWQMLVVNASLTQCDHPSQDYYNLTEDLGAGRNVLISICATVVFMLLLILHEYGFINFGILQNWRFRGKRVSDQLDALNNCDKDVLAERIKVENIHPEQIQEYRIVLQNLTKFYKSFLAVDNLCLSVSRFECFGLLGVNGAGKTSTFKMMTGDLPISSGQGWVAGFNLKQRKDVHKHIGYCPQFDALLDDLTGRETLIMFGLLRGVHQSEIKYIVEKLSKDLDFHRHLDKKVKEYSGGNKRKLSTAVALIGDPPIVFLDEPSTGMDPATKRNLWNTLCRVRDSGKCLVLTSHSMEECEALCTRIAIMVNGQFKCLGSTQHLKNTFSEGYTLTIKVRKMKVTEQSSSNIEQFVLTNFPSAVLREKYEELLTFYIADKRQPWSKMFGIMERAKKEMNIEDYSLGQTTLEQIFLSFTKQQRGEGETG